MYVTCFLLFSAIRSEIIFEKASLHGVPPMFRNLSVRGVRGEASRLEFCRDACNLAAIFAPKQQHRRLHILIPTRRTKITSFPSTIYIFITWPLKVVQNITRILNIHKSYTRNKNATAWPASCFVLGYSRRWPLAWRPGKFSHCRLWRRVRE
jgi:hypothetical protein